MLNQYSIFSGATAGAAAYAATYYFSPATIGAINFAVSSFLANYISAIPAVMLGYAIPALTAMVAGVLLAALFNAAFFAKKTPAGVEGSKRKHEETTELDGDATASDHRRMTTLNS